MTGKNVEGVEQATCFKYNNPYNPRDEEDIDYSKVIYVEPDMVKDNRDLPDRQFYHRRWSRIHKYITKPLSCIIPGMKNLDVRVCKKIESYLRPGHIK